MLAAIYLLYMLKIWHYQALYGSFNMNCVDFIENVKILMTFADCRCLLRFNVGQDSLSAPVGHQPYFLALFLY